MFVFVYLDHIGRAEPEVRCDGFSSHQHLSLPQSSRVLPSCDYIQKSEEKRKMYSFVGVLDLCETVPVCLHVHKHVSYDVLPLPVAPIMAFIPGLRMPLQEPIRKSSQVILFIEHTLKQ